MREVVFGRDNLINAPSLGWDEGEGSPYPQTIGKSPITGYPIEKAPVNRIPVKNTFPVQSIPCSTHTREERRKTP